MSRTRGSREIWSGRPVVRMAPATRTTISLAKRKTRSMSCSTSRIARSDGRLSTARMMVSLSPFGTPAGGLVQQKHLGLPRQRKRDFDQPPFAISEAIDPSIGDLLKLKQGERGSD